MLANMQTVYRLGRERKTKLRLALSRPARSRSIPERHPARRKLGHHV